MKNSNNSGSCWRAFAVLLLIGAVICSLSALALAASDTSQSSGGGFGSGNAGGGSGGSGNAGGGSTGSGGCSVVNGPTKFVPMSAVTETQRIKVGSGNSNRPGDTYLVQERTVTSGEYQMTVYTICTCENTHHRETSSSTVVTGTDTRYSSWRTVSVERG